MEKKENHVVLRRNFEQFKWKPNTTFTEYFNEKVVLADKAGVNDEEQIDYLIEGIPDENLQVHAQLQCFKSKSQILQAFAKIQLKEPPTKASVSTKTATATKLRCFNCNSLGHFAADCRKEKRVLGSCYGCGSRDHRVATCPQRKNIQVVTNEFILNIKFSPINNKFSFFNVECLLDTGSPVTLAKKSALLKWINLEELKRVESTFFGLNYSKLNTFGKTLFYVHFNKKCFELEIFICSDNSMSYDCILGRDFIKNAGLQLTLNSDFETKTMSYQKKNQCIESNIVKFECKNDMNTEIDLIMSIDIPTNEIELKINENIDFHIKEKLYTMFLNCYEKMKRPIEPRTKSEIEIITENLKPFSFTPRRLSYDEKDRLQLILDDYIEKGYIRPSESEFVSPIVLVKKKNVSDLRMCVDYRILNKNTAKDSYPLPLIDDLLDTLSGKKYFTKLDLKNGFFHVYVKNESIKYTSFITPLGQYEFLRMPFGLKNAPSVFQRFVNKVFNDMIRQGKLIIYMDDIMIATKEIEDHLTTLKEVFARLVENKLELRLDKCEFLQTSVTYLGYKIDSRGITADDKGIESIRNFPIPTNVHSVQSFLGLCSYFRRFVENFSTIAKPLYDLTKKDKIFKFGANELSVFELLKEKLTGSPVLALYDPKDETELHCDASSIGFGAILLQRKEDGKLHPIFYFSKRTTEAESKYHSFELETLAIIYALERFRIYLQGKKFKIVTDCNSLTLTLNKKEMNLRIARWALELQNYDYILEHRAGSKMQHVDALSRCHNIMIIESNTFEENLIICQNKDGKLSSLKKELEKKQNKFYEMRNGVIYKKSNNGSLLFCVPEAMEISILNKYHDEIGHVGIDKTTDLISKSYWFPKIREKVASHIQNCLKCIVYSSKQSKEEGFLNSIPKPNQPFEVIHVDHYGPVDNGRSLKHIFVVIDAATKFVRLYPTKTTNTKEVISHLKDYFRSYSRPSVIISDRGTAFTSHDFEQFLTENQVKHIKIATGSPKANGQIERVNRSLGPMIAKLVQPEKKIFWDMVIDKVEHTFNNTIQRSIGEHPSIMLFGIRQKGRIIDELKEYLENDRLQKIDNKILDNESNKRESILENDSLQNNIKEIRKKAFEKQNLVQEYNKRYVDKRRLPATKYSVNDYVMVKNFDSTAGVSRKLIPKFKGPYRICRALRNDRYVLEDIENFQHARNPYKGVWAVNNIRPWINAGK